MEEKGNGMHEGSCLGLKKEELSPAQRIWTDMVVPSGIKDHHLRPTSQAQKLRSVVSIYKKQGYFIK